jgi:hypothetical protein
MFGIDPLGGAGLSDEEMTEDSPPRTEEELAQLAKGLKNDTH